MKYRRMNGWDVVLMITLGILLIGLSITLFVTKASLEKERGRECPNHLYMIDIDEDFFQKIEPYKDYHWNNGSGSCGFVSWVEGNKSVAIEVCDVEVFA